MEIYKDEDNRQKLNLKMMLTGL